MFFLFIIYLKLYSQINSKERLDIFRPNKNVAFIWYTKCFLFAVVKISWIEQRVNHNNHYVTIMDINILSKYSIETIFSVKINKQYFESNRLIYKIQI